MLVCPTARLCESYYSELSTATIVRGLAALNFLELNSGFVS